MSRKLVYSTVLLIVFVGVLGVSINVHKVEAPYPIIYIKADGSIDPPTLNITSFDNVTYTFTVDINASIVVQKDNIVVDGAGHKIQGVDVGSGIDLWDRSNVTVKNVTVTRFFSGIYLRYSSNITILSSKLIANIYGIRLYETNNYMTAIGNEIKDNNLGIEVEDGIHTIYHNNFINNTNTHVNSYFSTSTWDNGLEGNYWDDYDGTDLDGGGDGIGDSAYVIDSSNNDSYPLMGPISFYTAGTWNQVTYHVHTISNSTVSDFHFSESNKLVSFNVTGLNDTPGFCRVAIPRQLLWCEDIFDWTVRVNGTTVPIRIQEYPDYTYLYFTYSHSVQNVKIYGTQVIPEFPSLIILPLFMIATLLAAVTYRRKCE